MKDIGFCFRVILAWLLCLINGPCWGGRKSWRMGIGASVPGLDFRLLVLSMTWLVLERQDWSLWLHNDFFVWCLCARDLIAQRVWVTQSYPVSTTYTISTCARTLPCGHINLQAKGRGALCWRAHKGAAERHLSLSPLKPYTRKCFGYEKYSVFHGRKFWHQRITKKKSSIIPLSEVVIIAVFTRIGLNHMRLLITDHY